MDPSSKPAAKKCSWCEEGAVLSCGNCAKVFYCGRAHQKSHWPHHKTECFPYKIAQDPIAGRYLVATKFLPAGSLVIRESPFVKGPKALSPLVCLTCHIPIIENNFTKCPTCSWPMCSKDCSSSKLHQGECEVLKRDKKLCGVPRQQGETPRYDLILVLRCLLLRESSHSDWEVVQKMESHWERRKDDAEPHHMAAVRYLTEVCKVDFPVDTVHQVRGAIITNSINTQSGTGTTLRGIYAIISLLNHSCYPNINLRSDKNHTLYIRTTTDVQKGEPFLFSYTSSTDPRWKRQTDLQEIYYFSCSCRRCSDSTELDTFFSSPKCPKCSKGFLAAGLNETTWTCTKCDNKQSFKQILSESNELLDWMKEKQIMPKHFKLFLKNVEEKCHRMHFVYFEALQKALSYLKDNTVPDAISNKKQIWEQVLRVLTAVEPGLTRRRGISLLELGLTVLSIYESESGRRKKGRSLPPDHCLLREASQAIEESWSILSLEPCGSTEDRWRREAEAARRKVLHLQEKALTQ